MLLLHPDRLFPADPGTRAIARRLHASVADLPILSPHGHTDPRWYAQDAPFPDPARLLVTPDHYLFRMLCSQGVDPADLGVARADGGPVETDGRAIWRRFCDHYHLFRGTPSRIWLDHALAEVFGIDARPCAGNADALYDRLSEALAQPEFRPRALYDRFNIAAIATTDGALDDLRWHAMIRDSGWHGRVLPTYRPDAVVDPDTPGFADNLDRLGAMTGADTGTWAGYLEAHRTRRAAFRALGATATDHGHPTAATADLPQPEAAALFDRIRAGKGTAVDHEAFRAQMLTEMARMSLQDGLVMQLHPGSFRNHSADAFARYGRDAGFDIPMRTDYVTALRPLLNAVGLRAELTLIVFTLDESAYARELAPLAGVYPALRLGPAWWFHDSPEGMRRYREMTTETAGFANTVGFNDDTRAYLSIPARHDMARRIDAGFLARLVAEHRLDEEDAFEVMGDLTDRLPRAAYRLG